jgi:transcriptional regulator of aromatic amino acid metabolism
MIRVLRDERGMALAVAIFALVVAGALIAGAFFAGTQEQRVGQNSLRVQQSFGVGEAAINEVVRNWNPQIYNALKIYPADVRAGRFREDLFYRLHVVAIHLPPLRARREDVAPLARLFAARLSSRFAVPVTLSEAAIAWLEAQPWPGNVRELENAIERAAVLSGKRELDPGDFDVRPVAMRDPAAAVGKATLPDAVAEAERAAIRAALEASGGNRRVAAKRLGVSLRTLFYKIQRYGLE